MLKKVIYLAIGILFLYVKDAFCDPISALVAIGSTLSGIGAALGPAGVLAAAGIGGEVFSLANQPKFPGVNQPNAPAAPDPNAAAEAANDQLTKDRRTLLLSGGETTLTGVGGAPLLGSKEKTLLGAG